MSSSTNRTRTPLTTLGILTAIILVMTFTPLGYIKTMGLEITLLHIPVILGAALTGPVGGMVLGCSVWLHQLLSVLRPKHLRHHPVQHQSRWHLYRLRDPRVLLGLVAAYIYRGFDHLTGKLERHHHRCTGHHLPYGNVHGHAGDLLLHQ